MWGVRSGCVGALGGEAYGEEVEGDVGLEGVADASAPFREEVVEREGIIL